MVGQLEQPRQARVQQPRLPAGVARHVQVGATHIADQQRVAAEDEPRLLATSPTVCDRIGVVSGGMAGGRDRGHDRVAELDLLAVGDRNVIKRNTRALR